MKNRILFFLFVISFFVVSCSHEKEMNNFEKKINNIISSSKDLSDLFRLKDKIDLKFPDSVFVSDNSEIKFTKNYILLNDSKTVTLLLFDIKGNYLRKISNFGEGPSELRSSVSTYLDNNSVYVLDELSLKIKQFSISGVYISDISISSKNNNRHFCVLGDEYFLHSTPSKSSNSYLSIYNRNGYLKGLVKGDSALAKYYYHGFLDGGIFATKDSCVYFTNTYNYYLYKINKKKEVNIFGDDTDWKSLNKNSSAEIKILSDNYVNHTIPFAFLPFYNEKLIIVEYFSKNGSRTKSFSKIYSSQGTYLGSVDNTKMTFTVSDGNLIGIFAPITTIDNAEKFSVLLYELKI